MKARLLVVTSLVLALAMFSQETRAQSSGARNALLTWGAVVKFTDGSDIPSTSPVRYLVYRGARGAAKAFITEQLALSVLLADQPLGEQCYEVTAVVGNSESMPANEVCKIMRVPAPTDGAIEAPTDGGIEN